MSDIKPELIEKAADIIYDALYSHGHNGIDCNPDVGMDLYVTAATRDALSAVADALRAEGAAQALRGAAETLDGAMPRHLGVSDLDYLDYDTDVEYGIDRAAEFLRARADEIEARDE